MIITEIRRKRIILLIVMMSYLLTAVDASIVITGLTKIAQDLKLSQSSLSWVQNAYLLTFGGCIILGGKLGDVWGRKNALNLALIIFGIGSAMAGIANSDIIMIFARLLQGIGAAILAPTALALLMDTFKGEELIKAIAWYSSISGLGASIGMVLGGFLASIFSWRAGFYINIPITVIMIMLSLKVLPVTKIKQKNFDIIGTILSMMGFFSLAYAINGAENFVLWLAIAGILLGLFIVVEKKIKSPLLPLILFSHKIRIIAYILRFLFVAAMMGVWFFTSEFLQEIRHFSPLFTGISFIPMTIFSFIGSMIVPRLINKFNNKKVLLAGLIILLIGFMEILLVTEQSDYFFMIMLPLIFWGLGQGLVLTPLTNLGIYEVDQQLSGVASGIVNMTHQIGGSIGLSIMVSIGAKSLNLIEYYHTAMLVGLIFIIISIMLTGLLNEVKK